MKLRFFAGLSIEEAATALGVSPRTVVNRWQFAQAWLFKTLSRRLIESKNAKSLRTSIPNGAL